MRRTIVALLVAAASLLAPLAITAYWLKGTLFDTHQYVVTVTPLSSNRAIDDAVASRVTDALLQDVDLGKVQAELPKHTQFLGLALTAGVRDYTQELVVKFLQTSEFRKLWVIANTEAHDALVAVVEGKPAALVAPDGSVDIDLSNIATHARQAVGLAGLDLYEKTRPAAIVQQKFVIVKPKSLGRIRWAATTLKRLAIILPVAALLLAGLALAVSRERRRTVFRLGGGLTAGAIAGLVLVAFGRRYYLDNIVGPDVPGDAARALYDTLLRNLRFDLELAILAGVLIAGGAALAGPSRVAVGIRSRSLASAGAVADSAAGQSVSVNWIAANKGTLRTITFICALIYLATASGLTLMSFVALVIVVLLVLGGLEILSRPRRAGLP
jgi:hypothetical protein